MDDLSTLKVTRYELHHNTAMPTEDIALELIYGLSTERWAITKGRSSLNKKPLFNGNNYTYHFEYDPLPSTRNTKFYNEYRFKTANEALDFWNTNREFIIATSEECINYWANNNLSNK